MSKVMVVTKIPVYCGQSGCVYIGDSTSSSRAGVRQVRVSALWSRCVTRRVFVIFINSSTATFRRSCSSVIFVNENENENGEKRENNKFVNEN